MLKFNQIKFIISILGFLLICSYSIAQQEVGYVKIGGKIKKDKKNLSGATISILDQNGNIINTLYSDNSGKFDINFDFNKEYTIEISDDYLVTKRFKFNTNLPENEQKDMVYPFNFTVDLFLDLEEVDMSVLDKPLAIVKFNDDYGDYDYDYDYAKSMHEKVVKLKEQVEYILEKRREEYNKAIDIADKAFKNKQYQNAKNNYERAAKIFPDIDYPKNQIVEINKLLQENSDAEKQYQENIAQADKLMQEKKYDAAQTIYKSASDIKPSEDYPKKKIKEIDDIKKEIEKSNQAYKDAIAKADQQFEAKKYVLAKTFYEKALEIIPDAKYPQEQLLKIKNIKSIDRKYEEAIKNGNVALNRKEYSTALTEYSKAVQLKPNESHPKEQIRKINNILDYQKKQAAKNKPKQKEKPKLTEEEIKKRNEALSEEEREESFLSKLAKEYPIGITEEIYDEPSRKVIRIIVNDGTYANEYKKIIYNWGGVYYFKNNASITESVFNMKTKNS